MVSGPIVGDQSWRVGDFSRKRWRFAKKRWRREESVGDSKETYKFFKRRAVGVGRSFFFRDFSIRSFFSESAGNDPIFHLLKSAGSTRAVRARPAAEDFQNSL
jgi:hypothetical protein